MSEGLGKKPVPVLAPEIRVSLLTLHAREGQEAIIIELLHPDGDEEHLPSLASEQSKGKRKQ